ncbi:MAG: thiamine diphosphokinase [Pseudomonadota bacterium]
MIFDSENGNTEPDPAPIVHSATLVTLLGAGALDPADLDFALARAPTLVAADGGADAALAAGHMPVAAIGDFDSLSDDARMRLGPDRLHRISEQDSTDFHKALHAIAAPGVLAVGFSGRRVDHELAAFHTLAREIGPACVMIGPHDAVAAVRRPLRLAVGAGTRVSLFPMQPVTGRSSGLRWPIEGISFAPTGRIGTSNVAVDDVVELTLDGPGMLVIVPRAQAAALIAGVMDFPLSRGAATG